jgi:hypothetical protein
MKSEMFFLCPEMAFTDGKLYGYLRDNANPMRHIILVLFALLALGGMLPATIAAPIGLSDKQSAMPEPAQTALITTPSMAAFLNDSWTPSAFVAPLANQATGVQRQMTRNNTTLNSSNYAIYDFLNDNYASSAATSPTYSASASGKGGKDKTVAWTGESIYQFLNDAWVPSAPIETYPQTPFQQHKMN